MNNIEYFEKQAKYWAKKLRIGDIVVKPKKMWAFAKVRWNGDKQYLFYNPNTINNYKKAVLMEVIFHELGHLYKNNGYKSYPYNYIINKQICEYIAQKRAFYWLKKYYSKYYRSMLKRAKSDIEHCLTYKKGKEYYFLAFSQIPEYAEHL